jgi:hypothetical protein
MIRLDSFETIWDDMHITIQGLYVPATPKYFCPSMGNWHPGDGSEVKFFKVTFGDYDITHKFNADEIDELESEFMEKYLEQAA